MCQAETAKGPPDRCGMDSDLMLLSDLKCQIIERQIEFGANLCHDPITHSAKLALSARPQPARLSFQDNHVIDELD